MDVGGALLHGLDRRRRVLVFIDLVQDIDVLAPVIAALLREPGLRPVVKVSRWLARESPRTAAILRRLGVAFGHVRRREVIEGRAPSLRGIAAVLAAAESSHPAHAAGHALARRAGALGIGAYALQHGLENLGLFGIQARDAVFASGQVICWFPPEATPPDLPAGTRPKLLHLGRPWAAAPAPAATRFDLGVFENLHWDRYTDADRERFLAGLEATARALPQLRVLLRPHPAGAWADGVKHRLAELPNLTLATPAELRAEAAAGPQAVRLAARVITTPSTVALDAALAEVPTALAVDGGEVYRPLPVLGAAQEWIAFARGETDDLAALERFRTRVLVEGDAAPRIARRLAQELGSST